MSKAIFFDRDGVINYLYEQHAPWNLEQFCFNYEAIDFINEFHKEFPDWLLFVVTNQPDIAYGRLSQEDADEMEQFCRDALPITDYKMCPHKDNDCCLCRKPQVEMYCDLQKEYVIDPHRALIVGDTWRDMTAARRLGILGILYNGTLDCWCNKRIFYLSDIKRMVEVLDYV